MTPERWQQVKRIFDESVEQTAEDRLRFVRSACAGDADLEREVEALLAAGSMAGGFLERPAADIFRPDTIPPPPPVPSRIGPYEIVRELAQGGMGVVYLAERSDASFRQTVALKLVRRGMDIGAILRRFHDERQILAALDHPNIARLLDGGSTKEGQPYFVMEYIPGRHLLEDCDARSFDTRQRLVVFQQLCSAVAYAHRNLVVHRDIKPGNILVTPGCVPKLLDFGLARLLQPETPDSANRADRTETALRFLTPEYASPEQVRDERITTASDIYSLGIVLYELLTGHRPYRVAGRRPDQIARAVCEEEPERPSTIVGRTEVIRRTNGEEVTASPESVSATREGDLRRLKRSLRGDLDNIVLKALRKEPERRYASVEQLSEDIARHLDGRPVRARKDTIAYRGGKFVARHKAAVASAVAVLALVLFSGVVALQEARVARRERAAAERRFNDVRELANTFLFEFHDAIRDLPGSTPARQLVVRRALEYLEKLSTLKSGDRALQRELARAYERVASVQGGLYESHLGETAGARRSLASALAIRESLARGRPAEAEDRSALAETLLQLAQVKVAEGDAAGAIQSAERAVAMRTALAQDAPADRALRARLARARRYLGNTLASSDRERSLRELRSAASTFEILSAAEPSNAAFRRELAITHQHIVYTLAGSAERDAAVGSYDKAVALQEQLIASEPGNFALRRELAYTNLSMGSFLEWSGDFKGALDCSGKALAIVVDIAQADPHNADAQVSLAEAYNSFGYAQARMGRLAPAGDNLREAKRLVAKIVANDPTNFRARQLLARLYESFGTVAEARAPGLRHDQRLQALREARDWYDKSRGAYLDLGPPNLLGRRLAVELENVNGKIVRLDRTLYAAGEAASSGGADSSR